MKKLKLSFSIENLQRLMGLDDKAIIAKVAQDHATHAVDILLVVDDELAPALEDGHLDIYDITKVGEVLRNPDKYRRSNKGAVRGGGK